MRGLIPAIISIIVLLIGGTAIAVHYSPASAYEAAGNQGPIPDEAIRIRIIANSDSDEDQATKRAVRDRVEEEIVSWGKMPTTIDAARELIRSHLQDVQEAADSTLQAKGAKYGAKVELAKVPFPAKTFEGYDYPAGEYEALRVTLGEGKGANWWCVLFPALCLAGATQTEDTAADVQTAKATQEASDKASTGQKAKDADGNAQADATKKAQPVKTSAQSTVDSAPPQAQSDDAKPETKFFLLVLLEKLFAWIGSLFS